MTSLQSKIQEVQERISSAGKKTSMSDIADVAGVSKVTVAKALHKTGGKNAGVGPKTAKRIREIADALNYRPNMAARMLQGRKSRVIAAFLDSYASTPITALLGKIEQLLYEQDYCLMVAQFHGDYQQLESYIGDFEARAVDGAISFAHDYTDIEQSRRLARRIARMDNAIFVGKPRLDDDSQARYVALDYQAGMLEAFKRLAAKGRQRIAFLMPDSRSYSLQERFAGYFEGIKTFGFPIEPALIEDLGVSNQQVTPENLLPHVRKLVGEHNADAIFASNDYLALMTMGALSSLGLRVPEDVAVVGFDNDRFSAITQPSLTTFDFNLERYARDVVTMLLEMLHESDQHPSSSPRHVLIPPRLIERQST